jgi:hypothetical protein
MAIGMLNRVRQEGLLHMIPMYYLKLSFVVTFFISSSNDLNHYIPKAKRGQWGDAMINVISKVAYSAGSRIMQVAEWVTKSSDGREIH